MPINCPCHVTSGPTELPGLIAESRLEETLELLANTSAIHCADDACG